MKIDKFGKGTTLQKVSERRRRLEDYKAGKLLDRMLFSNVPLFECEKEDLYYLFVKEIGKNRLQRFIDLNYVLLIVGLLLACSCIVVLVTGYDGNKVLFYVCCAVNLILCCYSLGKSFNNLKVWLIRDNKEKKSE